MTTMRMKKEIDMQNPVSDKESLIFIQMGCDLRIPRNSLGYVADLSSPDLLEDRLRMLGRYVPELVKEFTNPSKKLASERA